MSSSKTAWPSSARARKPPFRRSQDSSRKTFPKPIQWPNVGHDNLILLRCDWCQSFAPIWAQCEVLVAASLLARRRWSEVFEGCRSSRSIAAARRRRAVSCRGPCGASASACARPPSGSGSSGSQLSALRGTALWRAWLPGLRDKFSSARYRPIHLIASHSLKSPRGGLRLVRPARNARSGRPRATDPGSGRLAHVIGLIGH